MAAVRRSLFVVPSVVLVPILLLSTSGLVSAAAQVPALPEPSVPIQIDMSSDAAQGLIDRALATPESFPYQ